MASLKLSVLDQSPVPAGARPEDALANTIDLARHAERLGYRRYWLAEHHNTRGLAGPAPEVMVATVAAATESIRVGSGGVMLSHYSPLKVAEQFRVLAALHPGRIDLGIGRAPGGNQLSSAALRIPTAEGDRFPNQVQDLIGFLEDRLDPRHAATGERHAAGMAARLERLQRGGRRRPRHGVLVRALHQPGRGRVRGH